MARTTRWMGMAGIVLAALVCASCFSPWTGEEEGETGSITITIGGVRSRAAISWPPAEYEAEIEHTITLTRVSDIDGTPFDGAVPRSVPVGKGTGSHPIGDLVLNAFYKIEVQGSLFGEPYSVYPGSAAPHVVTITGPNTPVSITMIEVSGGYPYKDYIPITGAADLKKLADGDPEFPLTGDYFLTQTISLSDYASWTPIGSFSGTFDGNGWQITELVINDPAASNLGLFAEVSGGTVQNLKLDGVYINGNNAVGGITGGNNGGTISNCEVSGTVQGQSQVGGVVGGSSGTGTVEDCVSSATVMGIGYVGGVVGRNSGAAIENCSSTGTVEGNDGVGGVGGVAGTNVAGTIEYCFATGPVTADPGSYIGGVVGHNSDATVNNCYYAGTLVEVSFLSGSSPTPHLGGVAGLNIGTSIVSNCYALGSLKLTAADGSSSYVGGVVGRHQGTTVENCVALNGELSISADVTMFGRVAGSDDSTTLTLNYGRIDMGYSPTVGYDWDTRPGGNNIDTGIDGASVSEDGGDGAGGNMGYLDAAWWTDTLGWDPAVWDFTDASHPTLIGNPEP